MKKLLSLFMIMGLLAVSVISCKEKSEQPKTEDDKTLYALGTMFGMRLANLDLNQKELDMIALGLKESSMGKPSQVDVGQYQKNIQDFFKVRVEKAAVKVKEEGKAYVEKFLKEPGAQKTASGLAYKVLTEGTGKSPKETDIVEVHYHGTLINGTVFDSSVERNSKVKFPLNRVIRGWTEGLQLMKEGGKVRLVVPSDLAYGDQGAPPKIPGGATLVFDVELFQIVPPEATPATPAKPAAPAKKAKK